MSRYSATRGSSGPSMTTTWTSVISRQSSVISPQRQSSDDARLAHDPLGLLPDLEGDLVRIALLELRQEQLDGQRTGIALVGEFPEDLDQRRDAVAGNDARRLIEELARHVRHILEVHVADLARLEQIQILKLTLTRPEVIAVEENPHVRMRGLARHLDHRPERRDEGRGSGELGHRRHVELLRAATDAAA